MSRLGSTRSPRRSLSPSSQDSATTAAFLTLSDDVIEELVANSPEVAEFAQSNDLARTRLTNIESQESSVDVRDLQELEENNDVEEAALYLATLNDQELKSAVVMSPFLGDVLASDELLSARHNSLKSPSRSPSSRSPMRGSPSSRSPMRGSPSPVRKSLDTSSLGRSLSPVRKSLDTATLQRSLSPVRKSLDTATLQRSLSPVRKSLDTSSLGRSLSPVRKSLDTSSLGRSLSPVRKSLDTASLNKAMPFTPSVLPSRASNAASPRASNAASPRASNAASPRSSSAASPRASNVSSRLSTSPVGLSYLNSPSKSLSANKSFSPAPESFETVELYNNPERDAITLSIHTDEEIQRLTSNEFDDSTNAMVLAAINSDTYKSLKSPKETLSKTLNRRSASPVRSSMSPSFKANSSLSPRERRSAYMENRAKSMSPSRYDEKEIQATCRIRGSSPSAQDKWDNESVDKKWQGRSSPPKTITWSDDL